MALKKGILALESGKVFEGWSFGADGESYGELIFNTSMSGYQEILTDPSYYGQIITMTHPHIGNYGFNAEDMESSKIHASGLVVKEASAVVSNWRSAGSLQEFLKEYGIVGIEGVDTRAITRHIRQVGAMKAVISTLETNHKKLVEKAKNSRGLVGRDLVKEVTCRDKYTLAPASKAKIKYKVAVLDCGCKTNILRELTQRGCEVVVFPAFSKAKDILEIKPDGIMLTNGPGDPSAVTYVIETVKELFAYVSKNPRVPIFGICLGQQMLGLAMGGETYKLKFGHRGANHPVKDLASGRIEITSQNHGFNVKQDSLPKGDIEPTHFNLYDGTLEGFKCKSLPVFCVQFHPEASPGPHDANYLFDRFFSYMEKKQG
jgi:carbamoyl-phosphate synthase small subunit